MTKYNDLKQEYLTQHDLKELPTVLPKEEKHAVYSPSAAKRWINCPGSINACKDLPKQKPNFYSAEGTVAHEIAAYHLSNRQLHKEKEDFVVEQDGFKINVTSEMLDAVMIYVAFVRDQINKYDEQPEIERKVKVTEDCYGTADSVIYSPYRILIVNDYKHGAGIQVDAEMNEQMMIYALGKLLELSNDEKAEIPIIQMNIVQPRGAGESIKTFEIKPTDLLLWANVYLYPAIIKAEQPDAPLNPGDWCKYCPAALTCPALKKENLAVAKIAFNEPAFIEVLTPKAIADLLDKESMVMSFYKRLNEHAAELASKNTKIPGYTYQKRFGNRVWKDADAVENEFRMSFGESGTYKRRLLTPPEAERFIKENMYPEYKLPATEKPFTGYSLKKSNGKEITVKEVFSEVE
jgi:hypothetical protein